MTIPRNISRQFYLRVDNRSIINATGHSQYRYKLLVRGCELLAIALVALAGLSIINSFGWWAAVIAPLAGIFWVVIAGLTNDEGELQTITIALLLTATSTFFLPLEYALPLLFVNLSLWIHRVNSIIAQKLLINLIQHSWTAYDMLAENIEVDDPSSTADVSLHE